MTSVLPTQPIRTIVTHSGDFHADDVFAVATLKMLYPEARIVRTRDEEVIAKGDIVVDVGMMYEADENRFDHHQEGGAGVRDNGIPYAAFGLVWKHFGTEVAGSQEVADDIDNNFVQVIDAGDNGVETSKPIFDDVPTHSINGLVGLFTPTWREQHTPEAYQARFEEQVEWAQNVLKRLIQKAEDALASREKVEQAYESAEDKRIVVLEDDYPWYRVIVEHPEPLFVVYYRADNDMWGVKAVPKELGTFENRKSLPKKWGGLCDQELQEVTGVDDAVFAHIKGFLAVAKSREGALKLARLALES